MENNRSKTRDCGKGMRCWKKCNNDPFSSHHELLKISWGERGQKIKNLNLKQGKVPKGKPPQSIKPEIDWEVGGTKYPHISGWRRKGIVSTSDREDTRAFGRGKGPGG